MGEDLEAEVTAAFGSVIGLLDEDGADEAGDRVSVWEDADGIGAAADLAVQAFGLFDQICCHTPFGNWIVSPPEVLYGGAVWNRPLFRLVTGPPLKNRRHFLGGAENDPATVRPCLITHGREDLWVG